MVRAQTKIWLKTVGISAWWIFLAGVGAIIWDEVEGNTYLFPWVASWGAWWKVGTTALVTLFLTVFGWVAIRNVTIRMKDVTIER